MKIKSSILVLILFLGLSLPGSTQEKSGFKIVGYYSLRSAMNDFGRFPFKRVTHVNLFFMNPDTMGNFTQDFSALKPFISKAHKKNVKVLFSIAGGGPHPYYHKLLDDSNRSLFISNLIGQMEKYGFDGIDVDIEGSDIDQNYETFVEELGREVKNRQKLMTAAIAVYYKDQISDAAIACFDFVNVMVYDRTGPWNPEMPGQHSSYNDAVDDLGYFAGERGIPADKMVLGVPFYGYGFGKDPAVPVKSMNYRDIITKFHNSETADQWTFDDGMIIYYNGIPTIRQKTLLAKEKASGIMIWQLQGDTQGRKSLLRVIHKTGNSK